MRGKMFKAVMVSMLFLMFLTGCERAGEQEEKVVTVTDGYYRRAEGKGGEELRRALHEIITEGHRKLTYKKAYDALEYTDEDPDNPDNIILFYTGRSQPKKQRTQADPRDGWNREHVWPKSRGFKSGSNYAYTDLHHLRPADTTVNSSRGRKDFDKGGEEHKEAPGTRSDSDSWEPRDEIKGDVARMMFYMAVRYEGDGGRYDDYDLELVNYTDTETSSRMDFDGRLGKLDTLLEWHEEDPVDESERRRHERVYEVQGNRNPFIDNPHWVEYIWQD